jgi:hypothetical protein
MNFNITTIRPRGFIHSSAFREVIDSLSWALSALGHTVNVTENWLSKEETNIIFGAELLANNQPEAIPAGSVVYNLEQPSHPNLDKVKNLVRGSRCKVWEYSKTNFEMWRELGADVHYVPIGYTQNITRIPGNSAPDIDVLFMGWMTPRRHAIIEALRSAGVSVVASDKCYGGGRDNLISRAKICLNVHHDGRNLFEIVRVSYMLANYKCVVTEVSEDDEEYADLRNPALIRCKYEDIVDTVVATLKKLPYGFYATEAISKRDYIATVKSALTELTPQDKVELRYASACRQGDIKDFAPWIMEHAKGTILEIGTRDGGSTSAFLKGVQQNGGVVLSVDTADCSGLFAGHPQWSFIQTSSQNPKLHVPPLDMVLVDGDHSREGYRADLERFFPLVKPGGLILSHDIAPDPSLTLEALPGSDRPSKYIRDEYFSFAHANNLEHYELPGENGMGVLVKPTCIESEESWQASEALTK